MENIKMKRDGDKLILEIDLSVELGPSRSGKTILIASTKGNKPVPDSEATIGVNCFKKK